MERIAAPANTRSTPHKGAPPRSTPASELQYPFSAMRQRLGNRSLARMLQTQFPIAAPNSDREMEAGGMAPGASARNAARIHTGPEAAQAAEAVGARAFTLGGDIVFNASERPPGSRQGEGLLSHEMAHVAQNQANPAGAGAISRQPKTGEEETGTKAAQPDASKKPPAKEPAPPVQFQWKLGDLLAYPLLVDVWKDVVFKRLSAKDKADLKLKGTEGAAFYAWLDAALLADTGLGGAAFQGGSFGSGLTTYSNYLTAAGPLVPTQDVVMDGISRIVGLRLDDYLASDLFMSRLKAHPLSVLALAAIAQAGWSLYKGVIGPAVLGAPSPSSIGTFSEDWTSHLTLVTGLTGAIFKEQLKAPSFFDIGPLQLKTHPAFANLPFEGGAPPEGLTAEYDKGAGVGQGGSETKLGLTLNLPKLLATGDEQHKAEYFGDLSKYRGWQGTAWFSYDKVDPTAAMSEAGRIAESRLKGGALFGGGGHLFILESGARFSGDEAGALTSWFLRGGYGYAGEGNSPLRRIGFDIVYRSATAADALAPGRESGAPTASQAAQMTPFLDLQFGSRHKFGLRTSASMAVTGEGAGFPALTGGVSYTYVGDNGQDKLPVFRIDLGASMHRLDWWNPESPMMKGLQLRANYRQYFGGAEVMTGAAAIAPERAAQFDRQPAARKNTGAIFVLGRAF